MANAPHPYQSLIAVRAAAGAADWLEQKRSSLSEKNYAAVHAAAGRRLGSEPVSLSGEERATLAAVPLLEPEGWPLSRVARALIELTLCQRTPPESHVALIERLLKRGDNAEREAVLRSLSLLPESERFVALAIDSCRSHVQSVFEAIACDNPYPARHFSDEAFNQMVLKAFFTEVEVKRIVGLEQRRTPELRRMAEGYADERRAAHRSVPADLHLATGSAPSTRDID